MEEGDAGNTELKDVYLPANNKEFNVVHTNIMDRDILTIEGKVRIAIGDDNKEDCLYRELPNIRFEEKTVSFIPYFAWDNRGEDKDMRTYFPLYYGW